MLAGVHLWSICDRVDVQNALPLHKCRFHSIRGRGRGSGWWSKCCARIRQTAKISSFFHPNFQYSPNAPPLPVKFPPVLQSSTLQYVPGDTLTVNPRLGPTRKRPTDRTEIRDTKLREKRGELTYAATVGADHDSGAFLRHLDGW